MRWLMLISIMYLSLSGSGQTYRYFRFEAEGMTSASIKFKEINNLVLLPVVLNGSDSLFFILDTGSEHSVLFGSELSHVPIDTSFLRKVNVVGHGEGEEVLAFVSPKNTLKIGPVIGDDINLIYIPDKDVRFSELLGHPVHGIIGVSIFHSFVIGINYYSQKLTFYEHEGFKAPRRYNELDIYLSGSRPFIDLTVEITPRITLKTNLLIDLGESKPISLFLHSHEYIYLPYPNYDANLGKGINGVIEGKVARLEAVKIDRYELKNVIASFPDLNALRFLTESENRNGSLGSGILKRFKLIFDLEANTLYLRRTGVLHQPFNYDKTGLVIVASGDHFDKFVISGVVEDSPGEKAGFMTGDVITHINGEPTAGAKYGEILQWIENSGRKIEMHVYREGELLRKVMKVFKLL